MGFDGKNILEDEEPSTSKALSKVTSLRKQYKIVLMDLYFGQLWSLFWSIIDLNRLAEGVKEFVHAVQIQRNIDQQES